VQAPSLQAEEVSLEATSSGNSWASGITVRSVDVKPFSGWYQVTSDAENLQLDLSGLEASRKAVRGAPSVSNLAADMGGMGFIENIMALRMLTVLESTHMLVAARDEQDERFFYSSSACVYAAHKQTNAEVTALKECDAYPAMPEDGYDWEKLFTERMCRHFLEDFGLATCVARYHNVYGPHGIYKGERRGSGGYMPEGCGGQADRRGGHFHLVTVSRPGVSCTSMAACMAASGG
jgi:GDP-D-mannose 3',5'-epimerase